MKPFRSQYCCNIVLGKVQKKLHRLFLQLFFILK
jgi:hypothetical protein